MPILSLVKQPYEISFSRNPVYYRLKVTPYGVDEAAINTKVSVSLYAESEHYKGDFTEIKQVLLRPDSSGFCDIDWSIQLDALLDFYVPKKTDTSVQECRKQAIRYYIRYSLVNDYEQNVAPVDTGKLHVIKGGLAKEAWHKSDFFAQKVQLQDAFLRYSYTGETAGPGDPLWIYFLAKADFPVNALVVNLRTSYENTILQAIKTVPIPQSGKKWQLYCLAVGTAQQGLDAIAPGVIIDPVLKTVEMNIFDNVNTVNVYNYQTLYRLDYHNFYDAPVLHYHNSLGGFNTQVMRGQIDHSGDYDKQSVNLMSSSLFATQNILKPEDRFYNSQERDSVKGDTGWIPQERAEMLRDLLNSNIAYENLATKFKPVQIVTKSASLWSNKDRLLSLSIDWQDSYQDQNFTPAGFMPTATGCPDVDFLEITQEAGNKAHVNWQLPEGYDKLELRMWNINIFPPPVNTATNFILVGNSGSVDIDIPFAIPSSPGYMTLYFWARVICNEYTSPMQAGSWTTVIQKDMYKYVAPLVRNDFVTTYKGASSRVLTFPSGTILGNDVPRNGGTLQAAMLSSTGSAGGTFNLNLTTYVLTYTPPSGNFVGIDIGNYGVIENIAPGISSQQGTGKIYVTVDTALNSIGLYTGRPYMKISPTSLDTYLENGIAKTMASLRVQFFVDPLGTQPIDLTGLGFTFSVNKKSNFLDYGNATFTAIGTEMIIYHDILSYWSPTYHQIEEFKYTLLTSSSYFII